MIEVQLLGGGLGNWLFQYAAGRALALRNRTELLLDVARHSARREPAGRDIVQALGFFRIEARYSGFGRGLRRLLACVGIGERRTDYVERGWGFDPSFETLPAATRLYGYFQSERYWRGCEPAIRAELTPRRLPDDPAFREVLDAVGRCNSVSVHVRRGDYLQSPMHNVCAPAYYLRAMARMRELVDAPVFFVFSDDVRWCREHLAGPDTRVVALEASARMPVLDLVLMSRCRHHVIPNSTFSWWAAWLNDRPGKVVIAPDRWFNDEAMNGPAMRDTVPAAWHRVPCSAAA